MSDLRFDAIRGWAALLVVLGHARAIAGPDYDANAEGSIWWAPFYAVTGLGAQAVLVFFALSGYWVAGSFFRDVANGRYSARRYIVGRIVRIYLVLVPAVVLSTASLLLIRSLTSTSIPTWPSLLASSIEQDWWSSLGSLSSMQPNLADLPATNGALWSLGFEMQLYLILPFAFFLVGSKVSPWVRACSLALLIVIVCALGVEGFAYLLVWLLGAAVRVLGHKLDGCVCWMAVFLTVAAAVLDSLLNSAVTFALLAGVSLLLLHSVHAGTPVIRASGRYWLGASAWIGHRSFSIYAFHMPLLFLVSLLTVDVLSVTDGGVFEHLLRTLILTLFALIPAVFLFYVFENRTAAVKSLVMRRIDRDSV